MNVNFFWSGPDWQFINRVTIASHLKVGHEVILWLHGKKPNNKFWIGDMPITIKDANEYLDIGQRLSNGWNVRTVSTIFQYRLMHENGEYTSDCDAIALKTWPDEEWCLVSESKRLVSSVGVLRVPDHHPVLKCALKRAKRHWGNVKVFSKCCNEHNLKSTYPSKQFYPVTPHQNRKPMILLDGDIPNAYSYHVFFNNASKNNITEETILQKKYKNSLLKKIADWALDEYGYINEI